MVDKSRQFLKPLAVGALAGAMMFTGLEAVRARSRAASISDVEANPRAFWGNAVTLAGFIGGTVRQSTRTVDYKTGERRNFLSFYLYNSPEKTYTQKSVSVTLPADQFRFMPREGETIEVSGVLKAPSTLGSIEP